jgi:Flp pilus assembly protein TadB
VIGALLAGAGLGLGLLAIAAGLAPRKAPLAEALAAITREPARTLVIPDEGAWTARLGRPAAALLSGFGLPTPAVRRDLAILGRPADRLLAEQATAAITGLLLAPATAGLLAAAGLPVPWQVPAIGAVILGAAGFTVPVLSVRAEAAGRRADARHALASFLDLVVISISGGAGVEAALTYAAATGRGWVFGQIRGALETARLTRRPPWDTLGQLGRELGIPELAEMAASVTLAGTEGARVRSSLAAKAAALRTRQLADAETAAQAATERMSLPLVLLFAGYITLIGYPAIVHVLFGL